jgi:HK97 family phage major capsid protein
MKGIQQLRVEHDAISARLRDLIETNPSGSWGTEQQKEYDQLMAKAGKVGGEIKAHNDALQGIVDGLSGQGQRAEGVEWRNAETGGKIPVAYAKNGSISDQLKMAFPAAQGFDNSTPKASISEFMRGVSGMRLTEPVRNSLLTGTDSAGGYTLPAYLQLQMLQAMVPVSSLLTAGAGMARLDDGAKSYRIAAIDAVPTAAWRAEAGTLATSEPTFRAVDVIPRSLSFQFKVTRELLADSANIDQALFTAIAQAFAKELDRAGLRGSGTAPEIKGILNTAGIQAITNGAAGASLATTAYTNFIILIQTILANEGAKTTPEIMSPL